MPLSDYAAQNWIIAGTKHLGSFMRQISPFVALAFVGPKKLFPKCQSL
jgi:hypothetical protein